VPRILAAPTPTQLTFDGQNKKEADWGPVAGAVGTATLTMSTHGRGRVRSRPAGIACGRDCISTFVTRARITLTANPAEGYVFDHWSGTCSGTEAICTVRLRRPRSAVARFVRV
jgi:hypothetical protein